MPFIVISIILDNVIIIIIIFNINNVITVIVTLRVTRSF